MSGSDSKNGTQNVKVVIRLRPLSDSEEKKNAYKIIHATSKEVTIKEKRYTFDKVFGPESTQFDVYEYVVSPMIPDILSGYNCTIFAYGATGTGKTFTMTGGNITSDEDWRTDPTAGFIPRAAMHIFDQVQSLENAEYTVRVSFLELYNEEARDLLSDDERLPPLNLFSDPNNKGSVWIQGLKEVTVYNRNDIFDLLEQGNNRRKFAPTLMNHQSSRSHTAFSITAHIRELGQEKIRSGKLNLVDLAGCENIARSGAKDIRAVELANINKSLLTLGRVIQALTEKKPQYVPYRDSKLTRILQDSLGGRTKTCIVATLTPASTSYEESVTTLEYAHRAKEVKNCPQINVQVNLEHIEEELNGELQKLQKDLEEARSAEGSAGGYYIDADNYKEMVTNKSTIDNLNVNIKECERKLNELEEFKKLKLKELDDLRESFEKTQKKIQEYKNNIKELEDNIKRERHLVNLLEEKQSKLCEENEILLKTTEECSKTEDLLSDKVSRIFTLSSKNEAIAKELVNKMNKFLIEIDTNNLDMIKKHVNENQLFKETFKDILEQKHNMMKICKEISNYDFKRPTEETSAVSNILPLVENVSGHLETYKAVCNESLPKLDDSLNAKHKYNLKEMEDASRNNLNKLSEYKSELTKELQTLHQEKNNDLEDLLSMEDLFCESSDEDCSEEFKKRFPDVHKQNKHFNRSINKDFRQVKNGLKELINDDVFVLCDELFTDTNQFHNSTVEIIKNHVNTCHQEQMQEKRTNIDSYLSEFTVLMTSFKSDIMEHLEKFDQSRFNSMPYLDQLLSANSNLIETLESFEKMLDDLDDQFREDEDLLKSYRNNVSSLIEKAKAVALQPFEREIIPVRHEGDTPSKQSHTKPIVSFTRIQREDIINKYMETVDESFDESVDSLDSSFTGC